MELIRTTASIEVKVGVLPDIEREIDTLKKTMVPASEHLVLMHRVNQLWDNYNSERGKQDFFRWVYGAAIAALTTWLLLKTSGIKISF